MATCHLRTKMASSYIGIPHRSALRWIFLCTLLVQMCFIKMTSAYESSRFWTRRTFVSAISGASLVHQRPSSCQALDDGQFPVDPLVAGGNRLTLRSDTIGGWESPSVTTGLGKSRILARELSPLQQPFLGEQELYYPSFLFGSWKVTATLKQKIYPYGVAVLPSASLFEGSPRNRQESVGNRCSYEMNFFSTLPNTFNNQLTVNLGTGVPESRVIGDRATNIPALSQAYQQLTPVQGVEWDYRKDPTRIKLEFGAAPVGPDMRPLGPRRAEVFLTARQSEASTDGAASNNSVFCAAERSRSVTLVTRNGVVSDTETITEYRVNAENPDRVSAVQRVAVYLSPNPNSREGVLWQQTGGKAVAFFDYELEMTRSRETFVVDGTRTVERACVRTPKDVVQCE